MRIALANESARCNRTANFLKVVKGKKGARAFWSSPSRRTKINRENVRYVVGNEDELKAKRRAHLYRDLSRFQGPKNPRASFPASFPRELSFTLICAHIQTHTHTYLEVQGKRFGQCNEMFGCVRTKFGDESTTNHSEKLIKFKGLGGFHETLLRSSLELVSTILSVFYHLETLSTIKVSV